MINIQINDIKHDNLKSKKDNTSNTNIFKKRFSNFISFINCETFKTQKLSVSCSDYNNNGFIFTAPVYEYSKKNKDTLIIQTEFNNIIKSKFLHTLSQKSNQLKMEISPDLIEHQIIDVLIDFDNKMHELMENKYNNFKCIGKIIHNKGVSFSEKVNKLEEIKMINSKFIKNGNYRQYNKVVNYNISSKFPKIENFDIESTSAQDLIKIFNRIITDQKEFRMMISPVGWINTNNNTYGSYLGIIMLEIKYKGTKITSIIENNEVITKREIMDLII